MKQQIHRLLPVVEEGGYIPFPDHRVPPDVPYENYLYWEQGRFSVVHEHMLTNCVRRQLSYTLDICNRAAGKACVAFTTLSGERHEMGSLMLAIAASRGVHALYLGPDLPVAEIGRFCARVRVSAVAISVVTSPGVIDAPGQLIELRSVLPATIPIWLGGYAAPQLQATQLPLNTLTIQDLADFEMHLSTLPEGTTP